MRTLGGQRAWRGLRAYLVAVLVLALGSEPVHKGLAILKRHAKVQHANGRQVVQPDRLGALRLGLVEWDVGDGLGTATGEGLSGTWARG